MKLIARIAAAALIGVAIGAIDASAQSAPPPPAGFPARAALAPLSADQVKTVVAGHLILKRSDLKVGKVTEKDADTFDVELLKADGTVAEHALVDKTFARPAGALLRGPHGGPGPRGFGPGHGCGPMEPPAPPADDAKAK